MNSDKLYDVLTKICNLVENIEKKMDGSSTASASTQKSVTAPTKVEELTKEAAVVKQDISFYTTFIETYVKPVIAINQEMGGDYVVFGEIFDTLFVKVTREILEKAQSCKKPEMEEMKSMLSPLGECQKKVDAIDRKRIISVNYVKAMGDLITASNWFFVMEEPNKYVEEYLDASTFWMNKIRREAKDKKDQNAQEWCSRVIAMMKELIQLILTQYENGLQWNANGVAVNAYSAKPAIPSAPAIPAPAVPATSANALSTLKNELMSAMKDKGALNLRHVEKSEMSHKNPALRGNVKMEEKKVVSTITKPPRCEMVGQKWMVENQTEKLEVTAKMNETVYVCGCQGATILIHGKCKSVVVDSCRKTNVIFDKCVSTAEIVNCRQCKMQILVDAPTVAVDKTDGCTIYFPRECLSTIKITSSKCSDMNVSFPSANDPQEWIERAIPEQYVHIIKDDIVVTSVSDLYSS